MATAQKDLAAVNDKLVLNDPTEKAGKIIVQMLTGGAGTVVVEGTGSDDPAAPDTDWVNLKLTNPVTKVDADNIAAVGLLWADDPGYGQVRARKTVGVASCPIRLRKSFA